jgi:hypothetical protein
MIRSTSPARVRPVRFARGLGYPIKALLAVLGSFALAGCGAQVDSTGYAMTQRQRDSTLGQSVIPGAATVTRALQESDRAGDLARTLDSQVDSLAR